MTKQEKIDGLVKKLTEASDKYYNSGSAIMTDALYDNLEYELRALDPQNKFLKKVGAGASDYRKKFQHTIAPMLSCDKVKDVKELEKWIKKIGVEGKSLIFQQKIDGLSADFGYENGKLVSGATRGDGREGSLITRLADSLRVPATIPLKGKIHVRGELVIYKDSDVENEKGSNLRNVAAGIIGSKTLEPEKLAQVHFIAYQLLGSDINYESLKIDWLALHGFEATKYAEVRTQTEIEDYFNLYLTKLRSEWNVATDGLVLVVNDSTLHEHIDTLGSTDKAHLYSKAIKPPSQSKETELIGIEWNVTRLSNLVPIATFKTVNIGDSNINRCTLNNFEYAENLRLHSGDKIEIEKANDIIPRICSNLTSHKEISKDLIPNNCPSCREKLKREGIHLICPTPVSGCKDQLIDQILHWIVALEMDGLSYSFVKTLVEYGKIKSIADLYRLTAKDFEKIDGFGSRKIENALAQIEKSKSINIHQAGDAAGINLIGKKALIKLGVNSAGQFINFNGSGSVIAEKLKAYIKEHKKEIIELFGLLNIKSVEEKKRGKGVNVCFSGVRPHSPEEFATIEKRGDTVVDSISKNTQLLVVKDTAIETGKTKKAQALGIPIKSFTDYFQL